jgi:hypothetical protein
LLISGASFSAFLVGFLVYKLHSERQPESDDMNLVDGEETLVIEISPDPIRHKVLSDHDKREFVIRCVLKKTGHDIANGYATVEFVQRGIIAKAVEDCEENYLDYIDELVEAEKSHSF